MHIHLIDGTFELFRAYFSYPSRQVNGVEVGAVYGMMRNLASLITVDHASHLAVAFDHVIESFRNDLFSGYKTGEGLEPELYNQFSIAEEATEVMGLVTWPMVEFEADDALASAAAKFSLRHKVTICSPDKDLTQCVDKNVHCFDRIRNTLIDENTVISKFGVQPKSIPDLLGLVGDKADGIPGIPRWGMKSASAVLGKYTHLENIPLDHVKWDIDIRGKKGLCKKLKDNWDNALLYKQLATLRTDVPIKEEIEMLRWKGIDLDNMQTFCQKVLKYTPKAHHSFFGLKEGIR